MSKAFQLDARLDADTVFLFDWPLSRVLLMNDAQYPWCILVPRETLSDGTTVTELYELEQVKRVQLDKESVLLAQTMMRLFGGQKMNIAALGNVVSQLHVHHVVRYESDVSWPAPIWGRHPVKGYEAAELSTRTDLLVNALSTAFDEA